MTNAYGQSLNAKQLKCQHVIGAVLPCGKRVCGKCGLVRSPNRQRKIMSRHAKAKEFHSDGSVLLSDGTVIQCEMDAKGTYLLAGAFKVYLVQDQIIAH